MTTATRNPTEDEFRAFSDRIDDEDGAIARAVNEGIESGKETLTKLERFAIESEVTRLLDHTPYASGAGPLTGADLTLARNWAHSLAGNGLQRRLAVAWFVEQLLVDNEPMADGPTGKTVNEFMRHLLHVAASSHDGRLGEAIEEELDR